MKLVPLGDKIVLKQLEAEETTKSGIVLPGQAKEKPQEAEVIAVGPGGNIDGKEVVMQVKAGDKVIYSKYAGTDVELDGEEYIIVKQNDILAIVTPSFVISGAPNDLSRTTFLPFGPSVTFTVSASWFTPFSSAVLASAPYLISFAMSIHLLI